MPVIPTRPRFARPPSPKTGRDKALLPVAVPLLLAQPLHRHHAFAVGGVEHNNAPGLAALDADLGDAAADQLAAVGDQHELVGFLDRERRYLAYEFGAQRDLAPALTRRAS